MNDISVFAPDRKPNHDRTMDFLTKVEILLNQNGWPQYRLEREAKLATNRISRWKQGVGKGPSVDEGLRIARALGVSLDDLADETRGVPVPHTIVVEAADRVKSVVEAADPVATDEELILMVYRGLKISLTEAIRRLSTSSGPIIEAVEPKQHPG